MKPSDAINPAENIHPTETLNPTETINHAETFNATGSKNAVETKNPTESKKILQTKKSGSVKNKKLKGKPSRKLSINSEVRNTLNSIIDNVTDEEKMRQSLIFGALKKYSPKKEVGKPVKSPKNTEIAKPRKKKVKSKDGKKYESNEADDLTKELLSICKESNIDTPEKSRKIPPMVSSILKNISHFFSILMKILTGVDLFLR